MSHRLQRTFREVVDEIATSEGELDPKALRFWERIRIAPAPWRQQQYPDHEPFWVVAILGNRCLYFNDVEGGWGWGRFSEWGQVREYHCQQDEIHHTVEQTLLAIEHGGAG